MSKTKRILAFALAAVLAVVVLTGCKSIVQKVFGSSNEVQEDDTTQWAVLSARGRASHSAVIFSKAKRVLPEERV